MKTTSSPYLRVAEAGGCWMPQAILAEPSSGLRGLFANNITKMRKKDSASRESRQIERASKEIEHEYGTGNEYPRATAFSRAGKGRALVRPVADRSSRSW